MNHTTWIAGPLIARESACGGRHRCNGAPPPSTAPIFFATRRAVRRPRRPSRANAVFSPLSFGEFGQISQTGTHRIPEREKSRPRQGQYPRVPAPTDWHDGDATIGTPYKEWRERVSDWSDKRGRHHDPAQRLGFHPILQGIQRFTRAHLPLEMGFRTRASILRCKPQPSGAEG